MPLNVQHVMRRIRRCENETAAQVVLEHFAREYARAAIATTEAPMTDAIAPTEGARKAFEAAAVTLGMHDLTRMGDEYLRDPVNICWLTWQAALSAPTKKVTADAGSRVALLRLENACEAIAKLRTQEQYLSMIDGGQQDALIELDNARRDARTALAQPSDAAAEALSAAPAQSVEQDERGAQQMTRSEIYKIWDESNGSISDFAWRLLAASTSANVAQGEKAIYQVRLANGSWQDTNERAYRYNIKHCPEDTRIVYAAPQAPSAPAVDAGARDERAAFEAWANTKSMDLTPFGTTFDSDFTSNVWDGWQARAALATTEAPMTDAIAPTEGAVETVKIYETYSGQNGWLEVSQEEYDRTKDKYEHRIRRVPAPSPEAPAVDAQACQHEWGAFPPKGGYESYAAKCVKCDAVPSSTAPAPSAPAVDALTTGAVGFRTRQPGFAWVPWLTDDQETIRKAIQDAIDHGAEGEALYANPAPSPKVPSVEQPLTDRVRALFQPWPEDELGPTDEPQSQYRFGYNTAIEDALGALQSAHAAGGQS
jgi:hypothetical protein